MPTKVKKPTRAMSEAFIDWMVEADCRVERDWSEGAVVRMCGAWRLPTKREMEECLPFRVHEITGAVGHQLPLFGRQFIS